MKKKTTRAEATTSATSRAVPTRGRRRRQMVGLPDHTGLGWSLSTWEDSQSIPGVILGANGGVRIDPRSIYAELV